MTGDEQPVSTSDTEASSAAGPFAAANTSAQPPQSVGPSAHTGVDEDRHAQDTPRVLRIRPNPTLHGPAPVFMRRTNGPEKGRHVFWMQAWSSSMNFAGVVNTPLPCGLESCMHRLMITFCFHPTVKSITFIDFHVDCRVQV